MFSYFSGIRDANVLYKIIWSVYTDTLNYLLFRGYEFKVYEGNFILNEIYSLVNFVYRTSNLDANDKKLEAMTITLNDLIKTTLEKAWSGRIHDDGTLHSTIVGVVDNLCPNLKLWHDELLAEGKKMGLTGGGQLPWVDAAIAKYIRDLKEFVDHILDNSENNNINIGPLETKDLVELHSIVVRYAQKFVKN